MPDKVKKADVKADVMKALSTDEMTVLSNIQSLIEQLMQASAGNTQADQSQTADMSMQGQAAKSDEGYKESIFDDGKAAKAIVSGTSDAATPEDSKAKDMIDDQLTPEPTEENLKSELAKALATIMAVSSKVKKSDAPKIDNSVVATLNEVTKALKAISDRQDVMAKAFGEVLDGMGVTEQVEIARKEQDDKRKPIMNADGAAVVKFLADALNSVKKEAQPSNDETDINGNLISGNAHTIRKNLRMKEMFGQFMPKNFKFPGDAE